MSDRMPEFKTRDRMSECMSDRMPDYKIECQNMSQIECQNIESQVECQNVCQIECQVICQIECQNICQTECQNIEFQVECQDVCQNIWQLQVEYQKNISNSCSNRRHDMSWWASHKAKQFFTVMISFDVGFVAMVRFRIAA